MYDALPSDPAEFHQPNILPMSSWLMRRLQPHHHHIQFYTHDDANDLCDVRSEMRSVSNLLNLDIRSLTKVVVSSVSLFLWSLSSVKSSRSNLINTTFPVNMSFCPEFSFAGFSFLLVPIHRPPIHTFLFDIQKCSYILYFNQCRSLTSVVVVALQQCLICFTQRCSLGFLSGNAMYTTWGGCEKPFSSGTRIHRLHTGEMCCPSATPSSNECLLMMGALKYLNLTTSMHLCHVARSRTVPSRLSFGDSDQSSEPVPIGKWHFQSPPALNVSSRNDLPQNHRPARHCRQHYVSTESHQQGGHIDPWAQWSR